MTVHTITQLFLDEELQTFNDLLNKTSDRLSPDQALGRKQNSIYLTDLPSKMVEKLNKMISDLSGSTLALASITFAEYSSKDGEPNLPPHFDGDTIDMIIDFQLESNISWDLGVNKELYPLEDNSAIVFNPNTNIHWRPHRRFEDGEYVKMLFFRFYNYVNESDYSHMRYSQDHEILKPIHDFRDSLK